MNIPRPINKKNKEIFEILISKMKDNYLKLDNSDGIFMPVVLEKIGNKFYSLAHYYEQNGDLMADPEVVFYQDSNNEYYPCSFRTDGLGLDREYIVFENGKPSKIYKNGQLDNSYFCDDWLNNIKHQQEL